MKNKQLLLCPECKIQIPLISFIKSKGGIDLTYKCTCTDEIKKIKLEYYFASLKKNQNSTTPPQCSTLHELTSLQANSFCLNCSKWLCNECSINHTSLYNNHIFLNQELVLICTKHYANYNYYCHKCKVSLCKQCLGDFVHHNHHIEEISGIDPLSFSNECKDLDKVSQMIHQTKTEFIQYIDHQIVEYKKWKENIEITYEINNRINFQLKELTNVIINTIDVMNQFPNYSMLFIVNSINVTKPNQFKLDYRNLKDCYYNLKGYLNSNYILDFVPMKTYQCLSTLEGHEDWVNCIIELKDGSVASGSRDNTIRLWDFTELQCKSTLIGHKDWVTSLLQLDDGRLMSSSGDQTIKVWDLSSNECSNTLRGHKELVSILIKLHDSQIASGSWDTTIKVWDVISLTCIMTLEKNSQMVLSLIQLQNGYLASGSYNNIIEIWDVNTKKCLITLSEHNIGIWSLLQLQDGVIVSGARNGIMKLWNYSSMKCLKTIEAHQDNIYCLLLLKDGNFVSGSGDQTIKIWDCITLNTRTIIEGNLKFDSSFVITIAHNLLLQGVICLTQLRNGNIVSGSSEHTIKLWDY